MKGLTRHERLGLVALATVALLVCGGGALCTRIANRGEPAEIPAPVVLLPEGESSAVEGVDSAAGESCGADTVRKRKKRKSGEGRKSSSKGKKSKGKKGKGRGGASESPKGRSHRGEVIPSGAGG